MKLRFSLSGHHEDFALSGAQSESLVGIYDAIRSCSIDLCADALLLGSSVKHYRHVLTQIDDQARLKAIDAQAALAKRYVSEIVTISFVVKEGKVNRDVPFLTLKQGLGDIARSVIDETVRWAEAFNVEYGETLEPGGLDILQTADGAATPSLIIPIKKLTPVLDPTIEADLEALDTLTT